MLTTDHFKHLNKNPFKNPFDFGTMKKCKNAYPFLGFGWEKYVIPAALSLSLSRSIILGCP